MKTIGQITLLVILLSGCSSTPISPLPTLPNHTATPVIVMPSSTSTPQITSMPIATSTPIVPPLSAPTALYDENAGVQAKCVKINQSLQSGSLGTGVIILNSRKIGQDGRYERGFYLMDMETGNSISLLGKNDNFGDVSVSPDRTLLIANHVIFNDASRIAKEELLLISADGVIQKSLPWGEGWLSIAMWIDNQQFIVDGIGSNQLVFNPFTGEQSSFITPDLPNRYDGPWGYGPVVYNPSLTRAVYLAEPGIIFEFWDMQKKRSLLSWTQFANAEQNIPRWSPDGTKFIMYGILGKLTEMPEGRFLPYELYLVDNSGTVLLPALLDTQINISVTDYFWSPSGQFVALLAKTFDGSSGEDAQKLLILDIQTRQIVDYCVEFTPPYNGDPILIWSPDETQILLNDKYSENHDMRVILVDLTNGAAFPIAVDMIASGWMTSP